MSSNTRNVCRNLRLLRTSVSVTSSQLSELQGHTVCPAFILLPPGYYIWPSPRHHSFWVPLHNWPSYCTRTLVGPLLLRRWLRLRKNCFALTWKRLPGPAPSPLCTPGSFLECNKVKTGRARGHFSSRWLRRRNIILRNCSASAACCQGLEALTTQRGPQHPQLSPCDTS